MKTQELLKALSATKPALTEHEEIMEENTAFVFADKKVYAFNHEIFISYPVPLDIEGAVKAEELYQFLSKVKEEEFKSTVKDGQLLFKVGNTKAGFTLADAKYKQVVNQDKLKWKDLPENFIDMLLFTSVAASTDAATTPSLMCVQVENGKLKATDRYRICLTETETPEVEKPILIFADHIKHIARMNPTQYCFEEKTVHFKNEDGGVISCITLDAKFPDIEGTILPGVLKNKLHKIDFPEEIQAAVDKALVFVKNDQLQDPQITVVVKGNKIKIQAEAEYAWYSVVLANDKKIGMDFQFRVQPKLFLDVLKDAYNTISINDRVIMFSGKNWKYYVAINKVE